MYSHLTLFLLVQLLSPMIVDTNCDIHSVIASTATMKQCVQPKNGNNKLSVNSLLINTAVKAQLHEQEKCWQNIAWKKLIATIVRKLKFQNCFTFVTANRIATELTLRSCSQEKKTTPKKEQQILFTKISDSSYLFKLHINY